jgi:hypothetical protein
MKPVRRVRYGPNPRPVSASLEMAAPQRPAPSAGAVVEGRPHRGGNRLPPGHAARGRPPSYARIRSFGPDPERRDRHQRARTRRAVALTQARGQLSTTLAGVLGALLDASDDRVSDGWWCLATIARMVLGAEHYGEDEDAGQRTAGRWMHELWELGWVEKVHRFRVVAGQCQATSNLWRVVIPAELRAEVTAGEDRARARHQPRRVTSKAPASSPLKPPKPLAEPDEHYGTDEAHRQPSEGYKAALAAARGLLHGSAPP